MFLCHLIVGLCIGQKVILGLFLIIIVTMLVGVIIVVGRFHGIMGYEIHTES